MNAKGLQAKLGPSSSLQYLKGVGPERLKILARLGLYTLRDLVYFFPKRYEDRTPVKSVSEAVPADKQCIEGTLVSRGLVRLRGGQTILKAVLSDGTKSLSALWYNQPYLHKVLLPKSRIVLYGKTELTGRQIQMTHPEYEIFPPEGNSESMHTGRIVPVYPLTEDLSQKGIRQLAHRALAEVMGSIRDPLSAALRRRNKLAERAEAFRQIHFPESFAWRQKAYRRLVFDEFFTMQLGLQIRKRRLRRHNAALSHGQGKEQVERLISSLGFTLTGGQKKAIETIRADMASPRAMNRLIQGDVGSGKTAVAAAALVLTAANGFQGALMAPTEVLAQQQYFTLAQFLEPLGIRTGFLAQNQPPAEKSRVLAALADGTLDVVIGTHALIQNDVRFKKLGLAVIDEQHKFGVFQRAELKKKAPEGCHFLLMTATPIPRTLCQTLYGDLDVSVIAEPPKGRKPVQTLWVGEDRRASIYAFMESVLEKGTQAYVICPHIGENAGVSAAHFGGKNVLAAHRELAAVLTGRKVGFLHGRMKSADKLKIMQEFKEKKIDVLVSTIVIEVGVDVPNANLIIIENAEKFGLAQLHQLRGRVGRGTEEACCILFSHNPDEDTGARLDVFQKTQSGFEIAEKDLTLRGAGDVIGHKQHGLPEMRIGDLVLDAEILEAARREAEAVIALDPELEKTENRLLGRLVKDRFGADKAESLAS